MLEKPKIVTHSGSFHQDELFAIATILFIYPDAEVVRTRDDEVIAKADIAVDVGGINSEEKERYDHHQEGGAGKRQNGIPYASFGLVWKRYGSLICKSSRVADLVDKKMVQPIDGADCGYMLYKPTHREVSPYLFDNVLNALTPTWRDSESIDVTFKELIPFAQLVLKKEIEKAQYFFEDIEAVKKTYKEASDKQIIVLEHSYPWKSIISNHKEPMFVVHPDQNTGEWVIACVKKNPRSPEYRKMLPQSWAGKKKTALEEVTGIKGAEFCHNKKFIAKAWSKEGAVNMAKLALKE
jgi:uncharacterized UPF0160 family protein